MRKSRKEAAERGSVGRQGHGGGRDDGGRNEERGRDQGGGARVRRQPGEAARGARGRPPEHGGAERPRDLRAVLGDGAVPDLQPEEPAHEAGLQAGPRLHPAVLRDEDPWRQAADNPQPARVLEGRPRPVRPADRQAAQRHVAALPALPPRQRLSCARPVTPGEGPDEAGAAPARDRLRRDGGDCPRLPPHREAEKEPRAVATAERDDGLSIVDDRDACQRTTSTEVQPGSRAFF